MKLSKPTCTWEEVATQSIIHQPETPSLSLHINIKRSCMLYSNEYYFLYNFLSFSIGFTYRMGGAHYMNEYEYGVFLKETPYPLISWDCHILYFIIFARNHFCINIIYIYIYIYLGVEGIPIISTRHKWNVLA